MEKKPNIEIPLRILNLEDSVNDSEIIMDKLLEEGYSMEFETVSTKNEFIDKIKASKFDLILSDYNLPPFSGVEALKLAQQICPDVPFIFVSGTIGDDMAVEMLKLGASDYVLKNKLYKLPLAINRALREKHEEKALAWEQFLMSVLMDNLPDYIYFKDNNSKFIRISNALACLFKLNSPIEAVGKSDFDFFTEEHARQAFEDEQKIMQTGKRITKEERETWSEKSNTWVSTIKLPLRDKEGNIIGTFGLSMDITSRKLAEIELKEKTETIEAQNEELLIAKVKAEESDQLKTAFLHNISHEIRTPMNAIIGFSEFLNDPELIPEKRKNFTDIIVKNCNQLLSIISDIISIATIEAGQEKVKEKEIDLNAILLTLYQQFLLKVKKKNISLNLAPFLLKDGLHIISDETKLIQILTNLIDNALKFTNKGYINFGYTIKDKEIELFVEDTGIGIPAEMHEEIFKRFRQVETTIARQYGGSGLGLSISKAYVELMNGKMWLNSELEKGTTFYFTIPYKINPKNSVSETQHINGLKLETVRSTSILIAEDEESNFMLLLEMLSGLNINILKASNGLEAVEICKSNEPIDLVLMDIKMPVMDGYEATKEIKKLRANLPIIAQTAFSTNDDKNKALLAGCIDFISKPFNQAILITKINEHLHKE